MCIASLLNRRYLQVSGSVRVRSGVVGRLGLGLVLVLVLRLGLGLTLGLQLGIGIGFRRKHSWLSIFTPRRNHSLCLSFFAHLNLDVWATDDWAKNFFRWTVERHRWNVLVTPGGRFGATNINHYLGVT